MKMQRPADDRPDGGRARASSQRVARERQLLVLLGVCAAVLIVAGLSARATTRDAAGGATLQDAVRYATSSNAFEQGTVAEGTTNDHDEGGYTAVIIAQPADCDGNLGVFGLLERRSVSARIPFRLLLIEGAAADTVGLRQRLPGSLHNARLALLSDAQRSLLRQLGHIATPSLLLFDRTLRLRYAGSTPPGPVERTVQLAVITRLVSNHPQPATP